jgi:hypothetical protein
MLTASSPFSHSLFGSRYDIEKLESAPVVTLFLTSIRGIRLDFQMFDRVSVFIDNDTEVLPSISGLGLKMSVATCTHIYHRLLID